MNFASTHWRTVSTVEFELMQRRRTSDSQAARIPGVTSAGIFISSDAIAWQAATHLIAHRPVLGYGYSTEVPVFGRYRAEHHQQFDRVGFAADAVHNSYLGLALQLGTVGALLGSLLLIAPLGTVFRPGRHDPALRLALALALAGAALDAVLSSFFYSVGNVIAVSTWVVAALLVTLRSRLA